MSSQPTISNRDLTELRMWSLTKGFTPGVKIPEKYQQWIAGMVKDEMVICCDAAFMEKTRSLIESGENQPAVVEFRNRRAIEYCSSSIQLVTGCCIHTKTTMIALRIIRVTPWVDGYHPNSITVPEGHADAPLGDEWRDWFGKFKRWGEDRFTIRADDLQKFLAVNAEREVLEEIRHPDEARWNAFKLWFHHAIQYEATRKVVYLNSGTTSPRHLDTVFTVDASNAPYGIAEMIDNHEFVSGEPEKHEVIYIDPDSIGTYGPNNFGDYLLAHFFGSDLPKLFYPDQF